MDVHPILLKWCSYLTSRVQNVVVNEKSLSDIHVSSGVPQGSVLGPQLFLLYVNGATIVVFSPRTNIVLYADDMSLFKPINDAEDFMLLQGDMNSLVQWSTSSFLTFNPEKCKFMIVTRKRNFVYSPSLFLNGQAITRVFHYTYLGVYLHTSTSNLLQLYTSLIRPCLEYAYEVWNPHNMINYYT